MNAVSALDPSPGPPLPFKRLGNRVCLGNHPTRLALEIADNDNGQLEFIEIDPRTGERVDDVDSA